MPKLFSTASPMLQRLDRRAILSMQMCNVAHFYSLCSLFSYAAFLCVDAGWVPDVDHAGYMAGLLPAMVMLGRIVTSWPWGMLSDRIGRRRCLELSMYGVALGNLAFGVSTSAWAGLAGRFCLLGMACGWPAFIGPLSLDIGGPVRQSEVLTITIAVGATRLIQQASWPAPLTMLRCE